MQNRDEGRAQRAGARAKPLRQPGFGLPGFGLAEPGHPSRLVGWLLHQRRMLGTLWALEIEHRMLFLWLPVAFSAGILVYFAAPHEPRLWHGPLLAALALLPAVLERGARQVLGVALLFAALGFTAASWRAASVATPMIPREMITEVKGFVRTLEPGEARVRITLEPIFVQDVPPAALPRALRIGAPAAAEIAPGDFIRLRARLSPPSEAAIPGGYDFRRDSYFKGIGGVGYSLGSPQVEAAPQPPGRALAFAAMVDRGRNWLTERIAGTIGGQAGALSAALVTGKRGLISEPTNDDLRASGLYHIVSISGIHMVLAAGVLFWSIRALLAAIPALALGWPIKKIAAVGAMAGAVFYDIFSGSEVATERSLIMTLVMLGAILFDRPALAMRNLALSALIVLALEPESLVGPSFQMSFAAVACLIGANRVWVDWRRHHTPREWGPLGKALRFILLALGGMLATTLVATLATGPFSVFHFHRINPFGLIGNALALPLVSLIVMPCAVVGTLLSALDLDALVWRLMGEGVGGVLYVAEWVGRMENASYPVERFTLPAFALMVFALLVFVNFRTRLRALALVPLTMLMLVPLHPPRPDLVIDPSGKSALVLGPDGSYRLLAPNASNRFTLAQWLPAVGDARLVRDPGLRNGITCDKRGCTTTGDAARAIALSLTPDALREDCTRAAILVTPLPAPKGCAAALVLDRAHFERQGATLVQLKDREKPAITAALDPATHRPWRRAPPTGTDAGLPPAPSGLLAPRADGRRFFGLLPPPAPRRAEEGTPAIDEDPVLHATPAEPEDNTPPSDSPPPEQNQ